MKQQLSPGNLSEESQYKYIVSKKAPSTQLGEWRPENVGDCSLTAVTYSLLACFYIPKLCLAQVFDRNRIRRLEQYLNVSIGLMQFLRLKKYIQGIKNFCEFYIVYSKNTEQIIALSNRYFLLLDYSMLFFPLIALSTNCIISLFVFICPMSVSSSRR